MTHPMKHSGIALVEALVAVTLLSASLSATAALLVQALRYEREGACRTAAVRLASSLADELRTLRRRDGLALQAVAMGADGSSCSGDADDCAVEHAAATRLGNWRDEVAASLPIGSASQVEVLDSTAPAYLIRISWPMPGANEDSRLQLAVEP
jgi:type IV pilus modification protein PilV